MSTTREVRTKPGVLQSTLPPAVASGRQSSKELLATLQSTLRRLGATLRDHTQNPNVPSSRTPVAKVGEPFGQRSGRRCSKDQAKKALCEEFGLKLDDSEIDKLFAKFDQDEEGRVDFHRILSALVQNSTRRLQNETTKSAAETNNKFAASADVFTGEYANLKVYEEGLDSRVGLPALDVMKAMEREHCYSNDSDSEYTTVNYGGTTTCPRQEWEFVVNPDKSKTYPGQRRVHDLKIFLLMVRVDQDLVETPEDTNTIRALSLKTAIEQHLNDDKMMETIDKALADGADFEEVVEAISPWLHREKLTRGKLIELVETQRERWRSAELVEEEVIALRLYTGPQYVKYNAVLRDMPLRDVQALRGNRYTTTIHAITSGLLKLQKVSRLPESRKVWRGFSGMRLPDAFWQPDEYGCRGGAELGLMSTSTRRETAIDYLGERQLPTILEIEVGQVDRGASISFLSQYPGEAEILLAPLSYLEVIGDPWLEGTSKGEVIVVPCRVNVNSKCLTLDQLKVRRKTLHLAMLSNIIDETRRDLQLKAHALAGADLTAIEAPLQTGLEAQPSQPVPTSMNAHDEEGRGCVERLVTECRGLLARHGDIAASEFNDDSKYKEALVEAVGLKARAMLKLEALLEVATRSTVASLGNGALSSGYASGGEEGGIRVVGDQAVPNTQLIHTTKVWDAALDDFEDKAKVWELRSNFEAFPWSVVRARKATDVALPIEMQPWQLEIAFECLRAASEVIQTIRLGGARAEGTPLSGAVIHVHALDQLRGQDALVVHFLSLVAHRQSHATTPFTPVTHLHIKGNCLRASAGAQLVEELLRVAPGLQELDGIRVADLLRADMTSLDLTGKETGPGGGGMIAGLLRSGQCALTSLLLRGNRLEDEGCLEVVRAVARMSSLTALDLSNNALGPTGGSAVSEVLSTLDRLQTLDLGGNALGDEGCLTVAQNLPGVLQALSLKSNGLSVSEGLRIMAEYLLPTPHLETVDGIPLAEVREGGVETLDMSGKELGAGGGGMLACVLHRCASLLSLDVSSNALGDEGCFAVITALRKLCSLTSVSVGCNDMTPDGGLRVAQELLSHPSLTSIGLAHPSLTSIESLRVADLVSASATDLQMPRAQLGPGGAGVLAGVIQQSPGVQTLDVRGNAFGDAGCTAVAKALDAVRTLRMTDNGLSVQGGWEVMEQLIPKTSLETVDGIPLAEVREGGVETLDMSGKELGAGGGGMLACVLHRCASLRSLNVSSNALEAGAGGVLCASLSSLTSLQVLQLHTNGLGPAGAALLAPSLPAHARSLTHLDLSSNGFGPEGAVALAGAVGALTELQKLSLGYNQVGPRGGMALGPAFARLAMLTDLDITGNTMEKEGGSAVAEALASTTALTVLQFGYNQIGPEAGQRLAQSLPVLSSLTTLGLSESHLEDAVKEELRRVAPSECNVIFG